MDEKEKKIKAKNKKAKKESTTKKTTDNKKDVSSSKTASNKKDTSLKSKKTNEKSVVKESKQSLKKEVSNKKENDEIKNIKKVQKETEVVEIDTNKKKKHKEKDTYTFIEMLIIMILTLALGLISGAFFVEVIGNDKSFSKKDALSKFEDAYQTVLDNYYGEISEEELIENAISGMLNSLDANTVYTDVVETKDFLERLHGKYNGIGCEISMTLNNEIIIVNVFDDSPAKIAGLETGDIVLKVDGEDYSEKTSSDVANYIKNGNHESVDLEIKRNEEIINLTINIKEVTIPSLVTKTFTANNKKIGYINVSLFSSVTNDEFKDVLTNLEKEGIDALIIDVRYNSGGHLNVVTDIASIFLPRDKVIYQLQDKDKTEKKYSLTSEKRDYKIAVLTNNGSASASEILAASIKESYGGYVVGTKTYGKGTVQQTKVLSDGSMIKYTIQNWLTPNGNFIEGVGVEPTHVVEQNEEYYKNPTDENDTQLQEAIKLLSN